MLGGGFSIHNKKQKSIALGNYTLKATIGKGHSAVVKSATHVYTKQKVAIKILDRSGLDGDKSIRLKHEIDSLKNLRHPNIIQLYEIMETPKLICLVTEYASNGELYDYIINNKRLNEKEARLFFKQIVSAINYCHKNYIVHRDIKVENLLLDADLHVKLADFGFSSIYRVNELMDTWCGSPPYSAPELYLEQKYEGPKVDIWSLGVVLYVLVCRRLPFDARSFPKLKSQVISGYYNTPFFLSEDCKQLIKGMLTVRPNDRFCMDDIINHKWFYQINNDVNESQDLKNILNQIENISINDANAYQQLDENVLNEVKRFGIDSNLVLNSIQNKNFDENEAIYHLIETKLRKQETKSLNFTMKGAGLTYGSICNENDEIINEANSVNLNRIYSKQDSIQSNDSSLFDNHHFQQLEQEQQQQQLQEQQLEINNFEDSLKNDNNDEMDEYEQEMARQYLSKYGDIRRHTIGTNPARSHHYQNNNNNNNNNESMLTSKQQIFASNHLNSLLPSSGYESPLSQIKEINNHNIEGSIDFNQNILIDVNNYNNNNNMLLVQNLSNNIDPSNEHYNERYNVNNFQSQLLIPQHSGRRASDGGSNISLFKQFLSMRHTDSPIARGGSIVSGNPIKQASSDEDDINLVKSKKARIGQELELHQQFEPTNFNPRKKRDSFDASFMNPVRNNRRLSEHRVSEPNQFELLFANRNHLEQLYNQGLNNGNNDSIIFENSKSNSSLIDLNKTDSNSKLINDETSINDVNKINMDFHIPDQRLKNNNGNICVNNNIYSHLEINTNCNNNNNNNMSNNSNNSIQDSTNLVLNSNFITNIKATTNSLSPSMLHMIQEEQCSDVISTSTTPRLSQTSTTSNNSMVETNIDDNNDYNNINNNNNLNFLTTKLNYLTTTNSNDPNIIKPTYNRFCFNQELDNTTPIPFLNCLANNSNNRASLETQSQYATFINYQPNLTISFPPATSP